MGGGYSTQANAVVLDAAGNAYITGLTQGFATGATHGAYQTKLVDTCSVPLSIGPSPPYAGTGDAFVLKLDGSFTTAGFLTYLGGGCSDVGNNIALDPAGNIWLSGTTASPDFPLRSPFQASYLTTSRIPGFVSELSTDASQLLFSSFSEGSALALGPASVYLGGSSGALAFVSKIDPAKSPVVGIDSVTLVGAFPPPVIGPLFFGVAPGQLIQINGHNLGPVTKVSGQMDASGRLPFVLGNTVVFFDNISAPLLSVDTTSILCFVPFEVVSATTITVKSDGQVSNAVKIGVVPSAPQILNITNQDGSANAADHPAKAGSVITLYLSGLGQTNPPGADGLLNTSPLPVPLAAVTVYFPTTPAAVIPQFVGAAPGMIAGITQVNVQVPATIATSGSTNPLAISVNQTGARLYTTQQAP